MNSLNYAKIIIYAEDEIDSITNSMNMNLNKLQEIAEDRGTCVQQFMGLQRVGHELLTELQQPQKHSFPVPGGC